MLKSVEMFSGAGGLALGLSLAGFQHVAVLEWDRWACDTIRENQRRGHPLVADWGLREGDVRAFDYSGLEDRVDVVAGGPPCQPFSICGKHRGSLDARDMFPAVAETIRTLRPRAFIVENVKGLLRHSFASYFSYILLRLEFPDVVARPEEGWEEHLRRLQREKTSGRRAGLTYNVVFQLLNSADFGVPQRRERVFVVGFRDDLDIRWSFPSPTHSAGELSRQKWDTGEYWDRHSVALASRGDVPVTLTSNSASLRQGALCTSRPGRAWRTVRDALEGLPDPEHEIEESRQIRDHQFQPGVRFYPGHTGSPLDLPAKALKAGDHGVPGGENALVRPDGSGRYFTVRESARLQTFPDGYVFHGSWSEAMRQLGNAVPVSLAQAVGSSVACKLLAWDMLATRTSSRA